MAADGAPRRKARGMSPEEIQGRYPSLGALTASSGQASKHAWLAVFKGSPHVMHALLGDFIKQVYAQPRRVGQRPMPKEEEVDFQGLVYGEETDQPLQEILPKLMGTSERSFVKAAHMSRTTFQRLLRGEHDPDVNELRALAAAVHKPPTFFIEYRKLAAMCAFAQLLEDRPVIASRLYRQYLEVRYDPLT